MNKRTEYIQSLITSKGYQSYLEIGLGDGLNFRSIEVNIKLGVDPELKDKYPIYGCDSDTAFDMFKTSIETTGDKTSFDLIFIDGLHHADQVERDIVNAWNFLNKGGIILIHDIKPHNFEMQEVPRKTKAWTGDVWRAWYGLKANYPKLKFDYWDDEYGLGIIHKSRHKIELGFVDYETNFEEYQKNEGWLIKS